MIVSDPALLCSQWSLIQAALAEMAQAYAVGNRPRTSELAMRVLSVDRQFAAAWDWLARVALDESRPVDAVVSAFEAARLEPQSSGYRPTLARGLERLGSYRAARALLRGDGMGPISGPLIGSEPAAGHADRLDPRLAQAVEQVLTQARQLAESGRAAEAIKILAQADRWAPFVPALQWRLGVLLYGLAKDTDALRHLERAIFLDDTCRPAMVLAAKLLAGSGLAERAVGHYERARTLQADDALDLSQACCVSAIEPSAESIALTRQRMDAALDHFLAEPRSVESPENVVLAPTFFLAYHGLPNRALHTKIARAFQHCVPSLAWSAPHCTRPASRGAKLRVGFISQFFRSHSIGKTSKGLIAELSRERFEVVSVFLPPLVDDEVSRFIRQSSDRWVVLPNQLDAARRAIADLELDILFFQDIGMEPMSYLLAHARLAPVQCVSFGHPDTTGIPNMDYFVSSNLYEPSGAEEHYSEKLFALQNLPTLAFYYRPILNGPVRSREALGLDPHANLYLCPQTLFKIHPEFDALMGEILRRDPQAQVILVNRHHPEWTHALAQRLSRSISDVMPRIRVIRGHTGPDYLHLLAQADVMLDTVHFNGMNTSLEAFAVGTPVVTLPRALQRGRHTAGMYRRMGLTGEIAHDHESYIERAVALGTDKARRADLSRRILERCPVLYEDRSVLNEFERFFEEAWLASAAPGARQA